MQTWLTRFSFLDTAEDLHGDLLLQQINDSHKLLRVLLGTEENETLDKHPILQMWTGHEIALGAYTVSMCIEAAVRGYEVTDDLKVAELVRQLRTSEDTEFITPDWARDTDVLTSHRSNLIRRWPSEGYDEVWKGVPRDMPYLWPFAADNAEGYELKVSRHDKGLLASSERTIPAATRKRIVNL